MHYELVLKGEIGVTLTVEEARALDKAYYMQTFGERLDVMFARGQGCVLYDTADKPYWDFFAGIAVSALGHNHPQLTEAIASQAAKVLHVGNYFYNEPQARLSKRLVENSPFERVFFCNSGAEANEGAIKLARKVFYDKGESRDAFICAQNAFHGRTITTLAATGQEKYEKPYRPLTPGFTHVPYNDIGALRAAVTERTCAVMLEPIQGESGVIPAEEGYLKDVRTLCDENGILLILDEVQTGIGRTGTLFAFEQYGVTPDIVTLAKALGGGVPIGAVLARESVCAFNAGDHGTTFGGNPLACAAGLAVLDVLLDTPLLGSVQAMGGMLMAALKGVAAKHPDKVTDVRGRGLMLGMQLAESLPAKTLQQAMLERGFVIGTAGRNTLRFLPPLIIGADAISALAAALDEALKN